MLTKPSVLPDKKMLLRVGWNWSCLVSLSFFLSNWGSIVIMMIAYLGYIVVVTLDILKTRLIG